jgi:hypothetical protein
MQRVDSAASSASPTMQKQQRSFDQSFLMRQRQRSFGLDFLSFGSGGIQQRTCASVSILNINTAWFNSSSTSTAKPAT